jgi:hypothetical protein
LNTPILHQAAASPCAEKARLMLGFKALAWQAVDIPVVMPKLLGGADRRLPPHAGAAGRRRRVLRHRIDDHAFVLRRADERAGTLHVHFPRASLQLRLLKDDTT